MTKLPKKVLFVCYGNAARSVMAKYFCDALSNGRIIADSAGISPFLAGGFPPDYQEEHIRVTVEAMKEIGIDASSHISKHINMVAVSLFDIVVNMAPVSSADILKWYAPNFKGKIIEWSIQDPGNEFIEEVRIARDKIREKVIALISEIS